MIDKLVRLVSPGPAAAGTDRLTLAPVPTTWPVIDGLDANTTFNCTLGDEALLTESLGRLLTEYADLELSVPTDINS